MRYCRFGEISHKFCKREILWIWSSISLTVRYLNFSRYNLQKRVPSEHQGIILQNSFLMTWSPCPPLVYFLSGSSAASTAPDVLPSWMMMTPSFTSLTKMALTTWPVLPSERSLRDIRMSGDKKLKEANVADFHCNISQILDL